MRKLSATPVLAAVIPLLLTGGSAAAAPAPAPGAASAGTHHAAPAGPRLGLASLPLTFQRNEGQAAGGVRYIGESPGVTVLFTSTGVTLDLASGKARRRDAAGAPRQRIILAFLHASPHPRVTGAGREGSVNYFIGGDKARWRTGIPAFAQVAYHGLWPGVDAGFSARNGTLTYWFTLVPGASASEIQLAYTGARRLLIGRSGALTVSTAAGVLRDQAPVSTQLAAGRRSLVASRYRLLGGTRLGFSIGRRSAGAAVTIDPGLDYGTYLGGSVAEDAVSLQTDAAGDLYVFGQTESPDFPITPGAYQHTFTGNDAFFVTKLNPSGTGLIYSTFVGDNGAEGDAHGAIDSAGDAYVTGITGHADVPGTSSGFPVTRGAFRTRPYASDQTSVVFKLNPAGSRLLYSTYLAPDPFTVTADPQQIAVVPDGSVIVGENTDADFAPTTPGAFEPSYPGGELAPYVARLNPAGSALIYGTYLGAPLTNQASLTGGFLPFCILDGLTADRNGAAYIAGACMPRFPTTPGAYQASADHAGAGLLVKLAPGGRRLAYATYWGQSVNLDAPSIGSSFWSSPGIEAVAVDRKGDAYIAADVPAESIPATAGAYQSDCTPNDPGPGNLHPNCGGVAEFSPAGTSLLYSSYFGGNQNANASRTSPTDLAIDASGHMYVVGFASPGVIPTTPDAFQQTADPSLSLPYFLAVLGKGTLLYSTYFGGTGLQVCLGFICGVDGDITIAANPGHGSVFIGGTAEAGMPISPGAFQQTDNAKINTTWAARLDIPAFP
jgi:hypothetical protein